MTPEIESFALCNIPGRFYVWEFFLCFFKINLFDIVFFCYLCGTQRKKTKAMNAQTFIQNELDRRMNFVNDPKFREMVRDQFVAMGITPEDWNTNKAFYYMMVANEFCAIENAQA